MLLARPGTARERLQSALEGAGLQLVLVGDPLDSDPSEVRAHAPCNVVIAVDAEVEDALEERLVGLFDDPGLNILFEESAVVIERSGWDVARWSRHLGAKLLGHGDVLPAGHEGDEDAGDAHPFPASEPHPASTAPPATEDWQAFQAFDDVVALPTDRRPREADIGFRSALTAADDEPVDEEQAFLQVREDLLNFVPDAPGDRWQDFESPAADKAHAPPVAPDWSLGGEPSPPAQALDEQASALDGMDARISSLKLVEHDTGPVPDTALPANDEAATAPQMQGAVLLLGGMGGPDPLRQILQLLPAGFPVPVLVQQWLEGGQYDRLVRQMGRASALPVVLAESGMQALPGQVHILPAGLGLADDPSGARFVADAAPGFADVLSSLPPAAAVVVLSGTSGECIDAIQRHVQTGGQAYAQGVEGCYDHALPALAISRGAKAGMAAEIAMLLAQHWDNGTRA